MVKTHSVISLATIQNTFRPHLSYVGALVPFANEQRLCSTSTEKSVNDPRGDPNQIPLEVTSIHMKRNHARYQSACSPVTFDVGWQVARCDLFRNLASICRGSRWGFEHLKLLTPNNTQSPLANRCRLPMYLRNTVSLLHGLEFLLPCLFSKGYTTEICWVKTFTLRKVSFSNTIHLVSKWKTKQLFVTNLWVSQLVFSLWKFLAVLNCERDRLHRASGVFCCVESEFSSMKTVGSDE